MMTGTKNDMPDEEQDAFIIREVLNGNKDAFETLIKKYNAYVFSIVSRHLPHEATEDAAQEAFIKAYTSMASFGGRSGFRHWLGSIAVRTCYDFWRRYYRNNEKPLSTLTEDHLNWLDNKMSGEAGDAFKALEAQIEARDLLNLALNSLSPKDRMVLSLVHLEGLSVWEASDLLGWSVVNIKVRAHRSRQKLKKTILKLLSGEGR